MDQNEVLQRILGLGALSLPQTQSLPYPEARTSSDIISRAIQDAWLKEYIARLLQGYGNEDQLNNVLGFKNFITDPSNNFDAAPYPINALIPQRPQANQLLGI